MYGVDDDKKAAIGLKSGVGKKQTSFDVTNTPQAQKVAPGYSSFPPAQYLQATSDANKQREAVAADAVQTGLTRQAGGAVDSAMQVGALENAGVLPPSQGGSVTPLLSPKRVAQIKARQAAPLMAGVNQAIDQSSRVPNGVQLPGINQSLSPMAQQAPLPEPRSLTARPVQPETTWGQAVQDIANVPLGAIQVGAGALASVPAIATDYIRNTSNDLAGGNPLAEPDKYSDKAFGLIGDGADRAGKTLSMAGNTAKAGTLAALDSAATPANASAPLIASANAGELPAPAAGTATPTATAQAGPASDAGPQAPNNGFAPVGLDPKQYGASNDKIVGKVGANGVPEFSNDAADVAGAQGQFHAPTRLNQPQMQPSQQSAPNGSRVLASGTNAPVNSQDIASLGRASNLGNGVGTFSVMGDPGDAAKAIATYDRANAIRAETVKMAQAGEPRGLTVVKDSSRTPTRQEQKLAKLEHLNAQTGELQARGLRDQNNSDREYNRNIANDQLNQQKTVQSIQSGQISLETARRTEQLRQQLADPSIQGEQRAQIEAAYASLTNGEKDRYMQVTGGTNDFGGKDASTVFDKRAGKMINVQGTAGQSAGGAPPAGAIAALRSDPKMAAAFDQKYGQGAAAKYAGS
jgi:hypothetical protein